MVKIAVAGGTGNVATTLLAPLASSHSITVLTRSSPPTPKTPVPGFHYKTVDYSDLPALTAALTGFDACLSFLVVHLDPSNAAQRALIAACRAARVRRFAPAEWGLRHGSGVAAYAGKDALAAHLADLNAREGGLGMQTCAFQPSIFLDYFAHPHAPGGLFTWPFFVDFGARRAIVLDGGDQPLVLTASGDVSKILDLALRDERVWPAVGGVQGCRMTTNELLALGRRIRGGEWVVEHVKGEDIRRGVLDVEWVPQVQHPIVRDEEREEWSRMFVLQFFGAILEGAWEVGREWNERFPEVEFQGVEEYLTRAWAGKP
ncbi:hypothetical protein C7974DRAFT_331410 [Boeremia exigua]|uniref:uncharacterized protein n=1 Tax=Boeremia exigua TaxID=749465 RepID=UPI001E8E851A|nr:uncharacterized protein C7974DRAFT_331410 [Boeremia exigua]KAH6639807.1 hypothetical protein C7974DRAFT_331410 [Boeremia exigua]